MSLTPHQLLTKAVGHHVQLPPSINDLFRSRRLARGEHWLREGRVCTKLAFVREGLLRAYVETTDATQTRWAFIPGTFMTSIRSFGLRVPAEENIVAEAPCELLEISYQNWQRLQQDVPELATFWMETVVDLCGCYERRLHSLLIGDAGERYRYFLEHYPDFVLQVPQKYVAEMLGIAPRHLSRIRAQLSD